MKATTFLFLKVLFTILCGGHAVNDRVHLCLSLDCRNNDINTVCGWRAEADGVRLKIFKNECELLRYGCNVQNKYAYGITNIELCKEAFSYNVNKLLNNTLMCANIDCNYSNDAVEVCGLRQKGEGSVVRIFQNECELMKHNCKDHVDFIITDRFICNSLHGANKPKQNQDIIQEYLANAKTGAILNIEGRRKLPPQIVLHKSPNQSPKSMKTLSRLPMSILAPNTKKINKEAIKNIIYNNAQIRFPDKKNQTLTNKTLSEEFRLPNNVIIIPPGILNSSNDYIKEINDFFAKTHREGIPLREMNNETDSDTRRMLVKIFKPKMLFRPWLVKPDNVSEDPADSPTLNTCFHKCPKKCPDTYAPVCGMPGIYSRDPTLIFQNHCFMDVAQCKINKEKRGQFYMSNAYVETAFVMCVGDEMANVMQFMRVLRTLQKTGRLKKRAYYRYRVRNMRFYNENVNKNIQLMG